MKKSLTKTEYKTYYYNKDGVRVEGVHSNISGNVSNISGNVSNISGNVSNISGNVSNIFGDASNISGNLDDCEITDAEREKGIDINELVK